MPLSTAGKYLHLRQNASWEVIHTIDNAFPISVTSGQRLDRNNISMGMDVNNNLKVMMIENHTNKDLLHSLNGSSIVNVMSESNAPHSRANHHFHNGSLVIDSQNKVNWVEYYKTSDSYYPNKLRHYYEENGAYSYSDISNISCAFYSTFNVVPESLSIKIDKNSKLHVLYFCRDTADSNDIYYATNKSGTWVHEKIYDNMVFNSEHRNFYLSSSIAITGNGEKVLAYIDNKMFSKNQNESFITQINFYNSDANNGNFDANAVFNDITSGYSSPMCKVGIDYDHYFHAVCVGVISSKRVITYLTNRSGTWTKSLAQGDNSVIASVVPILLQIEGMPSRSYRP